MDERGIILWEGRSCGGKATKILRREQVSQPRFEPSTSRMRLNGVTAMLTGSVIVLTENPAALPVKKFPSC